MTDTDLDPKSDTPTNWQLARWNIGIGYIFFFAGIAAFTPYAAIYYRSLHFSGIQVGILASMPALCLIFTGAFWGAIADVYAAHRTLLRVSLGSSAVLAFVASRFENFWMLLVWITLLSLTTVPLRSLMDNYGVIVGEKTGLSFGMIRLWGAFGYSAFVLSLGRFMSREVTSAFLVGYSITLTLTLIITFTLPKLERRTPEKLFAVIKEVIAPAKFKLLLLFAFAQATVAFVIVVTLGVHIASHGGSNTQIGAAFAIAALSELPVFVFGPRLVKRFGYVRIITVIGILYSVRMVALALTTVPFGIIGLQMIHGITFGAFLVVSIPFARSVAGHTYSAAAQAVLTMASFGFGTVAGSMLGAVLMNVAPTGTFYLWIAAGMASITVIYAVGSAILTRRENAVPAS